MRVDGTLVRGGTSKCWVFERHALPVDRDELADVLVDLFGAADPRQLDGVGGGTSTTSKAAVVARSGEPGTDVEYLFAQIGIGSTTVEWGSNCGNCATAIALYAVSRGLVPPAADATTVRMLNLNTGARLECTVATPGGVVADLGDAFVPGVTTPGVPVRLTFVDAAGRHTGALLPTGAPVDVLTVAGSAVRVSLLDAGAPMALVAGADLRLADVPTAAEMRAAVPFLTEVRAAAGLAMGLRRSGEPAPHAIPKVGVVAASGDYVTTDGREIPAGCYDVSVRMLSMLDLHPAIGLTSAAGVAAAATVSGSTVDAVSRAREPGRLAIGTSAGVVTVSAATAGNGSLDRLSVDRAARILCTATIRSRLDVRDTA